MQHLSIADQALPPVHIRADASPRQGTGHIMRCIALAQAAQSLGLTVCITSRAHVPWVQQKLSAMNFRVRFLEDPLPEREHAHTWAGQLPPPQSAGRDWLILDGYHFGTDYQHMARQMGYRVLVIDDYAHLPAYSCDILLNQNPCASGLRYCGDIRSTLFGLPYALLRPEFLEKTAVCTRNGHVRHILLTLGGGDNSQHLASVIPYLYSPSLKNVTVRVMAGGTPQEYLQSCFTGCPATVEVLGTIEDMPGLLRHTDLCISAAGSTCWELCMLGIPFLVLSVAENQNEVMRFLCDKQMSLPFSAENLQAMMQSQDLRQRMAKANAQLVDGLGARRVIKSILAQDAARHLSLRKATPEDCDFILSLANDPDVRAVSFQQQTIATQEHNTWYQQQLDAQSPFYIVSYHQEPCGYVRFNIQGEVAEISVALTQQTRNRGFGSIIIGMGCEIARQHYSFARIMARIKASNVHSVHAFEKARFVQMPSQCPEIITMCTE